MTVVGELLERLAAADATHPADVALVRRFMSGLADEQIANEPQDRLYADQTERGIRAVLAAIHS